MPASRFSLTHLLIALSVLLALILAGTLLFLSLAPTPGSPASVLSSQHIVTAQTASGVDQRGAPTDATATFTVGQTVYIAYTISDAGPGTARILLYNNASLIDTQTQQFARRSTYNAYFDFRPTQPGTWEADLYWQAPGATAPGTLEQKVPFLVGPTTSSAPAYAGALSPALCDA